MGTNKEPMSTDLEVKENHYETVMAVGEEFSKGHNYRQIATSLGIESKEARQMIEEYKQLVEYAAKNGMNIIDKLNVVIEEVDRHYQLLINEAWDNKRNADMAEQYGTVNQSLKLIADIQKSRAAMFQQLNDGQDAELMAELEETQRRQDQIMSILRRLAEKFPQAAAYIRDEIARLDQEPVEIEVMQD